MSARKPDAFAAQLAAANAARNAAALFEVLDVLVDDLPAGLPPALMIQLDRIAAVIDAGKVFATQAQEYLDGQ